MMLTLLAMLLETATPVAKAEIAPPNTVEMTLAEVKAFNATVDKTHPYYIRCRLVEVTGSLAKQGRVCRTRQQWDSIEANGNAQARALVEDGRTRPGGQ